MNLNQSKLEDRYRNSRHSLPETDSYTVNLNIFSFDFSKENEVLNVVNQASDKSINVTLEICYLRSKI